MGRRRKSSGFFETVFKAVTGTGTDEMLHGLALAASEGSDRFIGLAFQLAEFALENHCGQVALFPAVEAGQVTPQELLQASAAAPHGVGADLGVLQEDLGLRVFKQRHPCHSQLVFRVRASGGSIPSQEKRLQ